MTEKDPKYSRVEQRKNAGSDPKHKRHRKSGRRSTFRKILLTILGVFCLFIVAGLGMFAYYAVQAPELNANQLMSAGSTLIYDAEGNKITSLGTQNRIYIKEDKLPPLLKSAIVSIEDKRFYRHHGVDPIRIIGAAVNNITHTHSLQGGSTLDQQLIKLSFFSTKRSDQTLRRKAEEAWLALELDHRYSKNQILDFYVNKVFMGFGNYGMETGSKFYYGKPLKDLDLAQTALIAGIPNAPSDYNPYSNPQLATERRNEVLDAMAEDHKITKAQANEAKQESITAGLLPQGHRQNLSDKARIADPYLKQVIAEAKEKGYDPYTGSLKIYTNMNYKIQKKLYDVANNSSIFPNQRVQIASTIINPNNGKVVAMLGGRNIPKDVTFGLNRAVQTDRTDGSTAKPLMDYGPAIEYLNWATYHMLPDKPYTYDGTHIHLYDWDHKYKGMMTMRAALVQSRNIPAIHALNAVGLTRAQEFLADLGMKFNHPLQTQNGIGIPSSTLQNAAAYAAFANGGTYYKPQYIRSIETADGHVTHFETHGSQAMEPSTAYMITDMLKGVFTDPDATGKYGRIPGLYEAGKTGTNAYPSDAPDYIPDDAVMDSWFNGYTRNYSISTWVGYDHQYQPNSYLDEDSTAKIPMKFYKIIMADISQGKPNRNWKKPSNAYVKYVNGVRQLYLAGSGPAVGSTSSSHSHSASSSSEDDDYFASEPSHKHSSHKKSSSSEESTTDYSAESSSESSSSASAKSTKKSSKKTASSSSSTTSVSSETTSSSTKAEKSTTTSTSSTSHAASSSATATSTSSSSSAPANTPAESTPAPASTAPATMAATASS